jgi:hemolysin III
MNGTAVRSREELANTLSHGLGLVGALAATPILIISAARNGTAANVVGGTVFGVSMVLLYLASTWYHAAPVGERKDRLRRLDHAAIYLLIAGSYTPFTLGVLRGPLGWTLFGIVWGVAALGVFEKLKSGVRYPRLSTALYLIMGWLALIAIRPLLASMPPQGIAWLVAGGLSYTGGVVFYAARRLPYHHFIWHLFVLTGTVFHFFAALWYSAGTG